MTKFDDLNVDGEKSSVNMKSLPSLKSLVLPTLPPQSKRAWNQVLQNSLLHYYSIKAQINLILHVTLLK